MSLYNMVYGCQPATFNILPMLGKHPDDYPRFRDCFIGKLSNDYDNLDQFDIPARAHGEEELISVYTRVGGNNRESYKEEIKILREMEGYVEDYDDDFDSTFATFIFKVPSKFKTDFNKIKAGKLVDISEEYKNLMFKVYPKLKEQFNDLFNNIEI